MNAPIWIVVFHWSGEQSSIVRCKSDWEASNTIYHNTYYGKCCLKITVKAWK